MAYKLPTACFRNLLCLIAICLFHSCLAVDRTAFKSCDQSSFCKRQRQHKGAADGLSEFTVKPESVRVQGASVNGILEHIQNSRQLSFELVSIKDSIVRLTVDEINPLRQRYRPLEALEGDPQTTKFASHNVRPDKTVLLTQDGNKVEINHKSFGVNVYSGEKDLVVGLNTRGLLKFEHFRPKPKSEEKPAGDGILKRIWRPVAALGDAVLNRFRSSQASSLQNNETNSDNSQPEAEATPADGAEKKDAGQEEEKTEEGMWEETFKTHTDTKPHGPSSIGMDINFVGFAHVYGIPEHADSFALKTTDHTDPYRLYNFDVFEYELYNPMALYGSIPFMMAHSAEKTVGVLWLNAAETWIDIHSSTADKSIFSSVLDRFKGSQDVPQVDTHWMSETGVLDIFVFLGPKPGDVSRQYASLTGVMPVPPLFSLGYHQCRWNYNDRDDVLNVVANFDEHDIPLDVMWLDIEYTVEKRYFTWDATKFPESKSMIETLASSGRKMVLIIDPHIKKDDNYKIYKEAKDNGYFVKNKENTDDYEGWCWPGASMYLDFLNPVVRTWWGDQFSLANFEGTTDTTFIWNDMNEPSVFNGPEITMHKDAKHYGDLEHRDVHNVYGFYNHMGTYQGLVRRSAGRLRPFILTRAFFAGSQRYSSVWTGDNTADWGHLKIAFPMLLSLSISGMPFVGADVGGFFKNVDEELLTRWYQAGSFYPFFRAHAHIDTKRREPWLFSNDTKLIIRDAIRRRYQLLPFWYTTFYEHYRTAAPVLRPLWFEFPGDSQIFDEDQSALIGKALLVKPVVDQGARSTSVYLPGEKSVWYDWDVLRPQPGPGAVHVETPMNKVPVFIRGGSILPIRERVRRSSILAKQDPFTLIVAPNLESTFANGTLYLDDGETFQYSTGQFIYRLFEYEGGINFCSLSSRNLAIDGKYKTDSWIEKIVVLNVRFVPKRVHIYVDDYKPTALHFAYDRSSLILVIRKPAVNVMKDWRIDVHSN